MSRKVINSTDKLAPITEYTDNVSSTSRVTPTIIKRKINSRKKLLTRLRLITINKCTHRQVKRYT